MSKEQWKNQQDFQLAKVWANPCEINIGYGIGIRELGKNGENSFPNSYYMSDLYLSCSHNK